MVAMHPIDEEHAPMSDLNPTPPPAPPPGAPMPPARSRRPLAWAAVGVVALGVAGGGAAAALAAGDTPTTLAVSAAATDDGSTTTAAEDGATDDGATDEAPADCAGPGGEHHRPGAHGTVAGVDGTTVTVTDDEGTETTVTTDDETTVLDVAEGAVADLAEGDRVLVMGETGEDDAVTAHRIVDLGTLDPETVGGFPGGGHGGRPEGVEPPADAPEVPADGEGPGRFRPTTGTVASVDGATVTVTTDDGDVVVTTTDETVVTVVTEIAVADLAEGDTVGARGETADDGTVAADVIVRGELPGGPGFGPGGPGGPGGRGGRGPGG